MNQYFIGFETDNNGFLVVVKNDEKSISNTLKQYYYSIYSNDFNKFKRNILQENNFCSFGSKNELISYQRRNELKYGFIMLNDFNLYYINENQDFINLKEELANININNIGLENFHFFQENHIGREINKELDDFVRKSDLQTISNTFEYSFDYLNKNHITLRDEIYETYKHDVFVIADKLAILGTVHDKFTRIFILNENKLPKHIQELFKNFTFNQDYLSTIAKYNPENLFDKDLIKHTNNDYFLIDFNSMKNLNKINENSLFDQNELKPTNAKNNTRKTFRR